jgi:hypothetical protein
MRHSTLRVHNMNIFYAVLEFINGKSLSILIIPEGDTFQHQPPYFSGKFIIQTQDLQIIPFCFSPTLAWKENLKLTERVRRLVCDIFLSNTFMCAIMLAEIWNIERHQATNRV